MPVNWFGNDVLARVQAMDTEMLLEVAFRIEERTKINIVSNDQVDTGFMLNSVYVTGGTHPGYSEASSRAKSQQKRKQQVMAPQRKPRGKGVVVAVGANYAIYQEVKNSFLFRALEQTKGKDAELAIEEVGRRRF